MQDFFEIEICFPGHYGLCRTGVDPALFSADQGGSHRAVGGVVKVSLLGSIITRSGRNLQQSMIVVE